MDDTILVLGDIVIPVGAGRGISQSFEIISNGELLRTVNGELVDLTRPENRKFRSSISCTDQAYPAIIDVWRGKTISVSFIEKFRQTVAPAALTVDLIRDYVPGSIIGRTAAGARITPTGVVDNTATFAQNIIMVEYLPVMDMKVVSYDVDRDEWQAETGWSLELEEV